MPIPGVRHMLRLATRLCGVDLLRWIPGSRRLARAFTLWSFALAAFTLPLAAQQGNSTGHSTPIWPLHNSAPDHATPDAVGTPDTHQIDDRDEACLLWTVTSTENSAVNVSSLEVSGKARGEFRKGCSDLKAKKLASAEEHLRKAVQDYPHYPAAWVLLGQVLEAGNRVKDARDACSQAATVQSDYAQAYLCLADVAAQLREWPQSLESADRSLTISPVHNFYANFYCAMAQFQLGQFPAAEKNALETIDADQFHRLPQIYLLLARIYSAEHNLDGAAEQLRVYLQKFPKAPDSDAIRKSLTALETQISQSAAR